MKQKRYEMGEGNIDTHKGVELSLTIDESAKTFKDSTGKTWPFHYELSREQIEQEIDPLLDKLHAKCRELGLPFVTVIQAANVEGKGTFNLIHSQTPGPRTGDVVGSLSRMISFFTVPKG